VRVRGVHHVAFAVEDLGAALDTYRSLFDAEVEVEERIEPQGVDAVYLRIGDGRVELVCPLGPDTPVGRFLEKRGPGMHHVAFEVDDVPAAVDELERRGADVVEPGVRPGMAGKQVAFVHPDSLGGVLAEVVGG
jgi:methylmalonyl-CoA/ethylmalonyl-CoA epimerase